LKIGNFFEEREEKKKKKQKKRRDNYYKKLSKHLKTPQNPLKTPPL
jgi:hypothetical protein